MSLQKSYFSISRPIFNKGFYDFTLENIAISQYHIYRKEKKKCFFFQKWGILYITNGSLPRKSKVIFSFSTLKLVLKDISCLDTISKSFLLTNVIYYIHGQSRQKTRNDSMYCSWEGLTLTYQSLLTQVSTGIDMKNDTPTLYTSLRIKQKKLLFNFQVFFFFP